MNEITCVSLENEMDLILAHKQSMRLAELAGLSLAAQTTFATAVSEVSRSVIGTENDAQLRLFVSDKKERIKYITATLEDNRKDPSQGSDEGFSYARKLVSSIKFGQTDKGNKIELSYRLPGFLRVDDILLEKWRISLNSDPAVSPYEEIKRKNRQLVEMAEKLRQSEQEYKSLTDSLPIMIFSMTKEGAITYSNQWLQEYTGQTNTEINATRWSEIVHPDDFNNIWENWKTHAVNPKAVITPERRLREAKTGEYRWHKGISIAITEENGDVKCWNTFMVDIHAQKLIEDALRDNRQLKEMHAQLEEKVLLLNQSNQQLEQFAYIASHDLQEPLRKIGIYSDFIRKRYQSLMPPEASQFFDNLISASDRMKILIQDILAYSIVRKERFVPVDLNTIAREMLEDLEITILEKQASVTIDILPTIEGNSSQLKQLFLNIVSNALKFTRQGASPSILISSAISGNEAVISFADQGIGFDEKYIGKMFDLFQRLHTHDKFKGTGIGLAICKKIVDFHKGTIVAKGTPGEGATFYVTLPLTQPELVPADDVAAEQLLIN